MTIEEGYTDQSIIPPIIEQQKGQMKIFQVYFRWRGTLLDTVVSKIFEDDELATLLPSPPTAISLDPTTSDPKQLATR